MTDEELEIYNGLSSDEQDEFDYQSEKHPDWTFKKVMTKLAFEKKTDETLEKGGEDPDPDDTSLWEVIVEGVKDFLNQFPLLREVVRIIENAISTIVRRGREFIDDILDWLF